MRLPQAASAAMTRAWGSGPVPESAQAPPTTVAATAAVNAAATSFLSRGRTGRPYQNETDSHHQIGYAVAVANDWAEATLHALQRRGRRTGAARAAVVELLGRQSCCVTAQEIYDSLRAKRRPVGLASIYRTLEQLSSEGLVHRIELGDGTTRF